MTQVYKISCSKNRGIKTLESLEYDRNLCNETKTKTRVYEAKIKTSVDVLEEPRDQDHGLEDNDTNYCMEDNKLKDHRNALWMENSADGKFSEDRVDVISITIQLTSKLNGHNKYAIMQ